MIGLVVGRRSYRDVARLLFIYAAHLHFDIGGLRKPQNDPSRLFGKPMFLGGSCMIGNTITAARNAPSSQVGYKDPRFPLAVSHILIVINFTSSKSNTTPINYTCSQ